MIVGPFEEAGDGTLRIPLRRPYRTPLFEGQRVALRLSEEDDLALPTVRGRRPGTRCGVITDLDTGIRYVVIARACSLGVHCCCDAELVLAADRN